MTLPIHTLRVPSQHCSTSSNTANPDNFHYNQSKHNTPSFTQTHSTKKVTNSFDVQTYTIKSKNSHLLQRWRTAGQLLYSIPLPKHLWCSTAQSHQNSSNTLPATKPSYTSLKRGLPSSPPFWSNLYWLPLIYNYVIMTQPPTPSSKVPVAMHLWITLSAHIGHGITDTAYVRYSSCPHTRTSQIHLAEETFPFPTNSTGQSSNHLPADYWQPPRRSLEIRLLHMIGFTQDPYIQQFQRLAFQKLFPTRH